MRLLIIDDEENIRRTTSVVLEGMGHETVGAENRSAALRQLEKAHFDVAFLDLKLEGESGLELLPELLKSNPQLDIVVFTAFASIFFQTRIRRLFSSCRQWQHRLGSDVNRNVDRHRSRFHRSRSAQCDRVGDEHGAGADRAERSHPCLTPRSHGHDFRGGSSAQRGPV